MRKSGLSSGFLKLGCYCSRILIHILLFSNTRLQQQAMTGITQCSKILIRILSFSYTRLQQQAMVGITQRSKILIRILPFRNTRLQQQTVAWITHGNLSDQFFCLDAMYEYEYFMVVKGYVHTVPDSEMKRHRN